MPKFFIYINHLDGSLYYTDVKLTPEETRCDQCDDCDVFICEAYRAGDVLKELAYAIDFNNSGGYDIMYVIDFINSIPWGDGRWN